jgi:hypothetical protein
LQNTYTEQKKAIISRVAANQNAGRAGISMPAVPVLQSKNEVTQKLVNEEEEPLQMKTGMVQLQGVEEKELQMKSFQLKNDIVQRQIPDKEKEATQMKPFQLKSDLIQKQVPDDEQEPLQGKFIPVQKKANTTGLPDNLKSGVENLSGIDVSDVKVHYNSDKPAQLQALAYAQGADIHIGPGQEKHLPHEAWHVVQQKQGRVQPTMQMKEGVAVNDDRGLEHEADSMGEKAKNIGERVLALGQDHTFQKIPVNIQKGPFQRTPKDAFNYLKRINLSDHAEYGPSTKLADAKYLLNDSRSPLTEEQKTEFLAEYNKSVPEDKQVKREEIPAAAAALPGEPPAAISAEDQIAAIWTPGRPGNAYENALEHYNKHVIRQGEFSGQFRSVLEYVQAAKKFWRESGGVSTIQGAKGIAVKFNPVSGRYTLSVDDSGKIATFFELQDIGGRGAPIDQIVELTGMDKGTIQELLTRLSPGHGSFGASVGPGGSTGAGFGGGTTHEYGVPEEHSEADPVEIDGMQMDEWDAAEYEEYKRKVDF